MATPEEMLQTMITSLPEKTGKSLEEWIAFLKSSGLTKHGEKMKMLKGDFGITHGYANLIVQMEKKSGEEPAADNDLVAAQYEKKPDLLPMYQALMAEIKTFGKDLEIAPKKAYVSLRRKKQFGLIQPSTKSRLDIGINLKGREASGIVEDSGSWNSMVSHRVRLQAGAEIPKELLDWLREAFESAG